jgi:hypothetical protein
MLNHHKITLAISARLLAKEKGISFIYSLSTTTGFVKDWQWETRHTHRILFFFLSYRYSLF